MQLLRTQRGFHLRESDIEHPGKISMTVPSETMSIREILTKFSRGQRVDAEMRREGRYEENSNFDSEDLEAAARLDLSDRDEIVARLREKNDIAIADLKRQQESLAAKKLARKQAIEKQKQESEKQKTDSKTAPRHSHPGASERGATGGQGEGVYSGESNEE